MHKLLHNDWHIWGEWPGIPWFHSCYNFGLALELKKRSKVFGLSKFAADYKNNVQKIYMLKHEWQNGGKIYLQEILKNPKKLENDLEKLEAAAEKLSSLNQQLLKVNTKNLSQKDLQIWLEKFHKANHRLWGAGMVLNPLELNQSYLSSYLRQYIEKNKKINQENWQILITPAKLSSAQIEEREFLKLVSKNRNGRLIMQLKKCKDNIFLISAAIKKFPKIYQALQNHHKKFCWIQYGWVGPSTTFDYYLDLFARFTLQENTEKLLNETLNDDEVLAQKQKILENEFALDKKHKKLLFLLRRLLFSKAKRMDVLYMGYFAIEPILRQIAKNLNLSMNQLYMLYCGWLSEILKSEKLNIAKLNESAKYSAFIKENNKLNFYVGNEARKKMAPILASLPKEKKVNELKGDCAFPGKVRGKVKIISNIKDKNKMQSGDILVSYATDPSLLPIMKKASAFVTNMGGLTCHAAIVAREMKKPCIVGTKIATKVLRDGDMVEVDATRGTVRKL
ncbi:MAG: PEP-utilizing enzyme [Patescibacteria group bacterium]